MQKFVLKNTNSTKHLEASIVDRIVHYFCVLYYRMPKNRELLILNNAEKKELIRISKSRVEKFAWVQRSKILLALEHPGSFKLIAQRFKISDMAVRRCYYRYYRYNKDALRALDDADRSGRTPLFDFDKQNEVINLACQKPKDLIDQDASEIWRQKQLAKHFRSTYPENSGWNRLNQSSISRIFQKRKIQPFKIKYYIEKRDPEFDTKLRDVMYFYQSASQSTTTRQE